jgi:predicted site-specific integrase-resolvase
MDEYVSAKKARDYFKVSDITLRRWAKLKKVDFITTKGGHRRYRIITLKQNADKIIYARVSSKKQVNDLRRQSDFLKEKYPGHRLITDIGSGLNFKRKGFQALLDRINKRSVRQVVVAHKDRLCRFGFDLFEWICKINGTRIIIYDKDDHKSKREELTEDLVAIISVFSSKIYGSRAYNID